MHVLLLNVREDLRRDLVEALKGDPLKLSFYDWPQASDHPRLRGDRRRFDLVILDCGSEDTLASLFPWPEELVIVLREYAQTPPILLTSNNINLINNVMAGLPRRTWRPRPVMPQFLERDIGRIKSALDHHQELARMERIDYPPPSLPY